MTTLGTTLSPNATKVMMLGSGELGKEVVIELQRLGFDYEITLLTVRHINGTSFLTPIGHRQEDGDYRESWQPQAMSDIALQKAQTIAKKSLPH